MAEKVVRCGVKVAVSPARASKAMNLVRTRRYGQTKGRQSLNLLSSVQPPSFDSTSTVSGRRVICTDRISPLLSVSRRSKLHLHVRGHATGPEHASSPPAAAPAANNSTARSGQLDVVLVHFDPANIQATLAYWLDFLGSEKVGHSSL